MRAAGRRAIVLFIYLSFMLIVLCSGERAGGEREGKWEGEGGGAELFLGWWWLWWCGRAWFGRVSVCLCSLRVTVRLLYSIHINTNKT